MALKVSADLSVFQDVSPIPNKAAAKRRDAKGSMLEEKVFLKKIRNRFLQQDNSNPARKDMPLHN
jgi:hypothetical protein